MSLCCRHAPVHDQVVDECGPAYDDAVVGVLRLSECLDRGFGELWEGHGRRGWDVDESVAGCGRVDGVADLVLD